MKINFIKNLGKIEIILNMKQENDLIKNNNINSIIINIEINFMSIMLNIIKKHLNSCSFYKAMNVFRSKFRGVCFFV